MTLRNVPKAHTLEQQRQEINLIASDLNTAIDGVQTFGGDKEFTGDITFSDSGSASFGDDADLKIYYDSSVGVLTSFIESDALQIRSATDTSELYATFLKDGPVELYHDGTKQFGTSATGASVLGDLDVSTDITCNSIINNAGGAPTFSIFNTGNALFEDVEATSLHMKDDRRAYFGTNEDASLYYRNEDSELRLESEVGFHVRWYDSVNTQYQDQVIFSPFGSTRFYYQGAANPTLLIDDGIDIDGVVKIEQLGGTGEVRLAVGGTQANYLKVFGSSGETYIRNDDNDIGNTATTINIQGRTGVALWQSTGNLGLQVDSSCAVKLYYQTSEKLKTTTDGVEITGTLDVSDTLDVVGNTTIGAPDITNASTGGVQAFSSGQLRIQRDGSGSATDKRFQMYYGTSETASITAGGDATFAGDLTLTDDTKEVTAQKIKAITTGTGSIMTIGGSNLGALSVEADVAIFDQIGFMAFSSAGINLGAFGTGALSSSSTATGTNGIFRKYEEGTWSTTVTTNSNLSAASFVEGYYTRIGQLVYIEGEVSYTNTGNNTELGFTVTPPFDMATDGDKGSVFCGSSYWSASRGFGGVVDNTSANDNEIFVMLHQAQNDTGTTGVCRFSLTYHAA